MYALVAFSPLDGWAFVKSDNDLLLLRPPYAHTLAFFVDELTLRDAVEVRGFEQAAEPFESWHRLIDGLRQRLEETHNTGHRTNVLLTELLNHPPPELAIEALRQVRLEMIPGNDFPTARAVLDVLASSEAIENAHVREEYRAALAELRSAHESLETARHNLAQRSIAAHFDRATKRFGSDAIASVARAVSERGHVWPTARP